ncbi:MAG: hypothetical protein HGB26_00655 [Desulfobulbaceae bacterium]|nr:hypothetical protein [Desulfobulbaceae bacterium]
MWASAVRITLRGLLVALATAIGIVVLRAGVLWLLLAAYHIDLSYLQAAGLFALRNIVQIEVEDALDFSLVALNSDAPVQESADKRYKKSEVKREARKLDTQTMYANWQKKYRELKRSKPGNSDRWYAMQIAKMDIASGRDVETIRKNMKK